MKSTAALDAGAALPTGPKGRLSVELFGGAAESRALSKYILKSKMLLKHMRPIQILCPPDGLVARDCFLFDTAAHELEFQNDGIDRGFYRFSNGIAQLTTRLHGLADDSDEKDIVRTYAEHLCREKGFRQRWRVRIESRLWSYSENVFFLVRHDCARLLLSRGNTVDEDYCLPSCNPVEQIERWSAEVSDLYLVAEVVTGFEQANYIRANAVIAKQDVSDSANQYRFHIPPGAKARFPFSITARLKPCPFKTLFMKHALQHLSHRNLSS